MMLEKTLADLEFLETHMVSGLPSISNLFLQGKRCGIYVLHFSNGELYAGQAVDVCRRYGQHRRNYDDIVKLSFKCVTPDKLNNAEKRVIQSLEQTNFRLRNIVHTSVTYTPSPFDEIMSPDEQEKWKIDYSYIDAAGERISDANLRRKYAKRHQQFLKLPYAEDFIKILRIYVQKCIPAFMRSEMYYWCCTCLLHKRPNDILVYSRKNLYRQEVFTIGTEKGIPFFSWHLANSPLQASRKKFLFFKQTPLTGYQATLHKHLYKPGGQDQAKLYSSGSIADALKLLENPQVVQAIRLFNLRSMQKGANWYYRNHCFDLADRLLE